MAKFKKGDRVKVKGKPHMAGQKTGEIVEVSTETPYAIKFDGMDMVHKWYVDSEIEKTDEALDDDGKKRLGALLTELLDSKQRSTHSTS